ncbi:MAG: phycobilisome rod-core linker polypeptide [Gloeomargaritaceae cyanobacterium C42_A2020_066]|nr:phycobilisome rod-core linker polypeptide [Gloeomargaritaceae cyanobacterium C42_A2020_066]
MALPLLGYGPTSQNVRVAGYEIPGDEQPRVFTTENLLSSVDMDGLIWAAYRQVFSEHQMLKANRQTILESQLRYGQITVRDFIRGLATSETFRRYNYDFNDNYRFVSLLVQRLLGRDVYGQREQIAWSIVLGTKGLKGFVDALLSSEEYLTNFGEHTVPYQRRRVLPQRVQGETPFNLKTPRYGAYYRKKLGFPQLGTTIAPKRVVQRGLKGGNPADYLSMAREVLIKSPVGAGGTSFIAEEGDFLAAVPYRKR